MVREFLDKESTVSGGAEVPPIGARRTIVAEKSGPTAGLCPDSIRGRQVPLWPCTGSAYLRLALKNKERVFFAMHLCSHRATEEVKTKASKFDRNA